ncbi:MAG: ABC transporter ATP-binding protein [Candidatus Heimdallarchaeaceae archaeon]
MKNNNKETIINLRNLTKNFGDFTAVDNLSLDIKKGEIVSLLGPNGAGKTTTMKMIARLLKPSEGEVWIKDNGNMRLLNNRNKDALLDRIGFLIENPTFYDHMTPKQILTYFATLKGYPRKKIPKRIEELMALVDLSDWIDKKTGTFSKGMKQRLGLVSAMIHDPDILVLDEPQTGLDPKGRKEIRAILVKLKNAGKTIFLSSHLLYEVSEISERVAIINKGKLVAFDSLENLENQAKDLRLMIQLAEVPEDITQTIIELETIIKPLTGLSNGDKTVKFNRVTSTFEVKFDGKIQTQKNILRELIRKDIDVMDFSVPRTNTLEDLYIKLVTEDGVREPVEIASTGVN